MTVNDLIKQLQSMSEEDRGLAIAVRRLDVDAAVYTPMTMDDINLFVPSSNWSGEFWDFDGPVPDRVLVWAR